MKLPIEVLLGRIAGVRTTLHLSLFAMLPIGWLATRSFNGAVASWLGFSVLMLVHELGHAIMARRQGLAVHEIRLYFMHGVCEYEHAYSKRKQALVAWGGVLAQMLLLLSAIVIAKVLVALGLGLPSWIAPAFFVWVPLNVMIAFVNLLPVPPLDGAVAWRGLSAIFARPSIDQPAPESKLPVESTPGKVVSLEQHRANRREREESD